jgi:CBS domain-containing protein
MDNPTQPFPPRLIRDLMTVGVLTCSPSTPAGDLARLLLEKGAEAVIVLDPTDGNALGMVSQAELVRVCASENAAQLTAEEIMREGVPQVPPDIPLEAAAQIMLDQGLRVLFLMHHAGGIVYPAGVLTFNHLLRMLAARSAEELHDLGIKASRQSPLEAYLQRRDAARSSPARSTGRSSDGK